MREGVSHCLKCHLLDDQDKRLVLNDLQARGLLDSTVVLISSDHGEEFGESGEKLEKHGSGYTRYQLVTPLVLHWPGRPGGTVYPHRTSHYDIVPTLMQELFGCSNGRRLQCRRQPVRRPILGLDGRGQLLQLRRARTGPGDHHLPNGLYEVRDWEYRLLREPQFRGSVLEAVSEQNARFYQD